MYLHIQVGVGQNMAFHLQQADLSDSETLQ